MIDVNDIIKLREQGYTYRQIGYKLGCSKEWVYKSLKLYKQREADKCPIKSRVDRLRIRQKIHEFCFPESMATKGCANCPIDKLDVCGESPEMVRLRKADKMIDELMGEKL